VEQLVQQVSQEQQDLQVSQELQVYKEQLELLVILETQVIQDQQEFQVLLVQQVYLELRGQLESQEQQV
jgi:hypothetical protein